MAESMSLLGFPTLSKLNIHHRLDWDRATQSELRAERLFFGDAQCGACHPAAAHGPTKTFVLHGVTDSRPCLHEARLLTLEDVVGSPNLVQQAKLTEWENTDLVAVRRAL